jgi:transposase
MLRKRLPTLSRDKKVSEAFVLELPLKVSAADEAELETRFEAARQVRNACLGEALKRLKRCRESTCWTKARKLSAAGGGKSAVGSLYRDAKKLAQFSDYDLQAFAKEVAAPCSIREHLDAHTIQKQATLAFQAVESYAHSKRGRPRFRGKERYRSVEGKSNAAGIRWKDGMVLWKSPRGRLLRLHPLFDKEDPHGVERHALSCKVKYTRLVQRRIRGKKRFFVQLIVQGKPLQKHPAADETIGIDVGPSTLAVVSAQDASLRLFCPQLDRKAKRMRVLQRALDRSRRGVNPENFLPNGTIRPGAHTWTRSKRYLRLQGALGEMQRRLAAQRKQQHGVLANQILAHGKKIRMEKLSYRAFQRDFGRSVAHRAPGLFVSLLRRKAESAGGSIEEFCPYKTALSQTCHCGERKKKDLSERWHSCSCDVRAQRDLYSAFLAQYVENDHLDRRQAIEAWPAAEPLLERALSRCSQQANGRPLPSSFGPSQSQSLSHAKDRLCSAEAADVVGSESRELRRGVAIAVRTPWL